MKRVLIRAFLVVIVFINYGCPKPCIEANYSFGVNTRISPDRDTISIGDTLYLISTFSSKLKDQNTGLEVDYSNAVKIGSTLGIGRTVKDSIFLKEAVFDFDYVSFTGKVFNDRSIPSPNAVQQLFYEEINENYELKIGLIPKKKGIYALGIGNGLSVGRKNSKSCEKAGFSISVTDTKQHFNIYQNIFPDHQVNEYELQHAYHFIVK